MVYDLGDNDELAKEVLKIAEEEVAYRVFEKTDKKEIIKEISEILDKDSRIEKGWVFGSFARGDNNPESYIDILFQVKENVKFSIFDQLGIREQLIKALNREIDFVEHDTARVYGRKCKKGFNSDLWLNLLNLGEDWK
ncbi:Predicted nucleotidyltransferase [Aquiflexum balticum DSM 16537]|uniref:Predicted nucleotidyltransferase n=1 Tax=Aquiflexum balticum DSM 16537 TaxID=758820 RepID=A0A1W2GYR2_9BACT|nr:nucleotidyltransferase domain-containing protein [Aquiflexum balticum]SMD41759.1 Predicted nucleotidyltransferase [Aquiflexum balticum DSM 16537]